MTAVVGVLAAIGSFWTILILNQKCMDLERECDALREELRLYKAVRGPLDTRE